jgi:hypothetical protein
MGAAGPILPNAEGNQRRRCPARGHESRRWPASCENEPVASCECSKESGGPPVLFDGPRYLLLGWPRSLAPEGHASTAGLAVANWKPRLCHEGF